MDWQTGSNDKLAGLIHFEHVAFVVGSTATCESLSTLATTTICVGRVQRRTGCVATTCLTEYVSQIVLHRVCFRECGTYVFDPPGQVALEHGRSEKRRGA